MDDLDIKTGIGFTGEFRPPEKYATIAKLITRDLNRYRSYYPHGKSRGWRPFPRFTKEDIARFLADPGRHERQLRDAVRYIYNASSHFRRLIQYFVGLSDLSYVVSPYRIDEETANIKTTRSNYKKVLRTMASMNVKTQFANILTVCLREDVFYGTLWVNDDSILIQQLPSNWCAISSIEENVFNVSFDFTYFESRQELLDFYPPEFREKYELYVSDRTHKRWIELDAPNSFAIKCSADIPHYAIPPFAGILPEVFDLEDYKQMKLAKTAIDNYAMIVMTLGLTEEGDWQIDLDKAKEFYYNLDAVLPDEIGSILTPMPVDKISFEKSNTGDNNTITEAEQNLYSAAGVSSLLFNNARASANALLLSIKADQCLTYGIVKNIEAMVNRFLHRQRYGKNWKVNFLDVSPFNRKEMGDQYLKACQYGIPMLFHYGASQGMSQEEMNGQLFLQNDVLGIRDQLKPLQSSSTLSADEESQGGAPTKDIGELTDSGEQSREDGDDW